MSANHSYQVYTVELGPFRTLADLHRDLSNHQVTFANDVYARGGQAVVSVSHSVVAIGGKLFASVVTTTDSAPQ